MCRPTHSEGPQQHLTMMALVLGVAVWAYGLCLCGDAAAFYVPPNAALTRAR